jgi:hypothetical protein
MKLGLVGLPMSGKTTVFNALTGLDRPTTTAVPGQIDVQLAVVDVPDPRLEQLSQLFDPKKTTYAKITYADVGGVSKGISEGGLGGPFRNELSQMDGYLYVLRAFENPSVPHPEETINPQRDLAILDTEILLTDLLTVENRISRLQEELGRGKNREANQRELALFQRLQAHLEAERPLRDLELSSNDERHLRSFAFLTLKPRLLLVNFGDEKQPLSEVLPDVEGERVMGIQGALEAEIAQLDDEDADLFMSEYDITEPVRDRVIQASYDMLSIQTFFTVGEDECRAWPHPIGATAQQASSVIHSDLEKGFIRAEIIPWDTLIELGTLSAAKADGKLRLEGRGYIVQDGDIMHVRHSS